MKSTKILNLIYSAVLSAVVAWALSVWFIRTGKPVPISTPSLIITLPLIAVVVVLLAIPIFRYRGAIKKAIENTKSETSKKVNVKRVDPFYAIRVALLAKATALAGALFTGWHIGVAITIFSEPTDARVGVLRSVLGFLGALLMVVCGLIVERACRIPPDAGADTDTSAA